MKRFIRFLSLSFALFGLSACTLFLEEPDLSVLPTPPPSLPIPSSLTPLPLSPTAPLSSQSTPMPAVEPSPLPTTEPTATVDPLELAVEEIIQKLNNHEWDGYPLADPFYVGVYGQTRYELSPIAAVFEMRARYAGDAYEERPLSIEADVSRELPDGITFEMASAQFQSDQEVTDIVYSSGWGVDQPAEALLYFGEANGQPLWLGTFYSFDGFKPSPSFPMLNQPPAVDALLEAEATRAEQLSQLKASLGVEPYEFPFDSNVNASFSTAIFPPQFQADDPLRLIMLDIETGEERQLLAEDMLRMTGQDLFPRSVLWLNESTALIGYSNRLDEDEPSWGRLARLDVDSGELERFDFESIIVLASTPLNEDVIVFSTEEGIYRYDDQFKEVTALPFGSDPTHSYFFSAPAMSPDERFLIRPALGSIDGGSRSPDSYLLIDLEDGETTIVANFDFPPIGGGPPTAAWGPNGRYALIEPAGLFAEQDGITLVNALEPERSLFLGIGSSNGRWIPNSQQFIFDAWANGVQERHIFDTRTQERFRLVTSGPFGEAQLLEQPEILPEEYVNEKYRFSLRLSQGWTVNALSSNEAIILESGGYRLSISLRNSSSDRYAAGRSGLPAGEIIADENGPFAYTLDQKIMRRFLVFEDQVKMVFYTDQQHEMEMIGDGLALFVTLYSLSNDYRNVVIPAEVVMDADEIVRSFSYLPAYTATDPSLADRSSAPIWSEATHLSPDGMWKATSISYEPDDEAYRQQEAPKQPMHRQSFVVRAVEGSASWQVIDRLEGWGLGVGSYVPFKWESETLYFTYEPVPHGDCGGSNGSNLWSLDLMTGEVEQLVDHRVTLFIDYQPTIDTFVYTAGGRPSGLALGLRRLQAREERIFEVPIDGLNPGGVALAPDGKRVALLHLLGDCGELGHEIFVADLDNLLWSKVYAGATETPQMGWHAETILSISAGPKGETRYLDLIRGESLTEPYREILAVDPAELETWLKPFETILNGDDPFAIAEFVDEDLVFVVDESRLLYTGLVDETRESRLYDLETRTTLRVDLPAGAIPLLIADEMTTHVNPELGLKIDVSQRYDVHWGAELDENAWELLSTLEFLDP